MPAAAPTPAPSVWRSYRLFYSQFRQNFTLTGAIAPSGRPLAHAITSPLAAAARGSDSGAPHPSPVAGLGAPASPPASRWSAPRSSLPPELRRRHPLRVLEVGAGTGVFTAAILRHLRPGDELDVYEINPSFQPCLQARLGSASERGLQCRLHIADIATLAPQPRYDFIISGLPLNNFPAGVVDDILRLLVRHLRPGGTFSYFEYPFLRGLKRALVRDGLERARLREVETVAHGFLRSHQCRHSAVPLNLPPAVAHHVWPA